MGANKRILVVDDDAATCEKLEQIAAGRGWHIDRALDGDEGWRRLREGCFDLVITGVHLPKLDGLDLLARIRRECPATHVVVMTAASTPERLILALRRHAFAYFRKPFSESAVAETIAQAFANDASPDDVQVLSAVPHWISLKVRARMENADRVTRFLREAEMQLKPQEREQLATAFRELLLNAIEHGSGADPDKWIWVSRVRTAREVVYYIRDRGEGFSFEELAHAAVLGGGIGHVDVREQQGLRPGGYGIFLARRLADEVIYNEKGNEVLLVKYVDGRE